jgi:hypothetical protein
MWDEKHRSTKAIADLWGMGIDLVRELFADDDDVMDVDRPETRNKRGYTTGYISNSAMKRVHAKLIAARQRKARRLRGAA